MPKLNQSQSIILGKVLEQCVDHILASAKFSYDFSESYEELMTRPDFLIYEAKKPIASIAVTCTQDSEAMQMKRWRYIDEVAQIKSYYGNSMLMINCEFGNKARYKKNEIEMIDCFFDASIWMYDCSTGPQFLGNAINLVQDGKNTDEVVSILVETDEWKTMCAEVAPQIRELVKNRSFIVRDNPFGKFWDTEHRDYLERLESVRSKTVDVVESYLRYSVQKGLITGSSIMHELILSVQKEKPLSDELVSACDNVEIRHGPRIGKEYITDSKFIATIKSGLTTNVFDDIYARISNNPSLPYILRDIEDMTVDLQIAGIINDLISNQEAVAQALYEVFTKDKFQGIEHYRVWILDAACAYLNVSTAHLNSEYIVRFGRESISNIIDQFINKNEIGIATFSDKDFLRKYCNQLAEVILIEKNNLDILPSIEDIAKRYRERALLLLGKQPFANPMQRFVEVCLDRNGIDYKKGSVKCILSDVDQVPSSMRSIREIYQVGIGGRKYWIKAIAAYDGVKDKTREIAARGRLLQHAAQNNAEMVFIYDGNWTSDLLRLLMLSGWRNIIPVFSFDTFLKSLPK